MEVLHTSSACITGLAFHKGLGLVSADQEGNLCRWDIAELAKKEEGGPVPVSSVEVGDAVQGLCLVEGEGEGVPLAVVGTDGNLVSVWDLKEGKCVRNMQHKAAVNSVAPSLDGGSVFAGDEDGALVHWDLKSGEKRGEVNEAHADWLNMVAVGEGGLVATAGDDGFTKWWREGEEVQVINFESEEAEKPDACNALRFIGGELLVAVGGRIVRMGAGPREAGEGDSGEQCELPEDLKKELEAAVEAAKGDAPEEEKGELLMQAMAQALEKMKEMKANDKGVEIIGTFDGHTDDIRSIVELLDSEGRPTQPPTVATAGDDSTILFWRLDEGASALGQVNLGGEAPVFSLCQHGGHIYSGDNDGRLIRNPLPAIQGVKWE